MTEYAPTTEEIKQYATEDYGQCGLFPEEFDRWLAEHDRQVAERAWNEGYDEWAKAPAGDQPLRDNPYRAGEMEGEG